MTSDISMLQAKCEDLESRSRRNNLRLLGVEEGAEGPRPTNFIAVFLQDLLQLDEKPSLDEAHRINCVKPQDGKPPSSEFITLRPGTSSYVEPGKSLTLRNIKAPGSPSTPISLEPLLRNVRSLVKLSSYFATSRGLNLVFFILPDCVFPCPMEMSVSSLILFQLQPTTCKATICYAEMR